MHLVRMRYQLLMSLVLSSAVSAHVHRAGEIPYLGTLSCCSGYNIPWLTVFPAATNSDTASTTVRPHSVQETTLSFTPWVSVDASGVAVTTVTPFFTTSSGHEVLTDQFPTTLTKDASATLAPTAQGAFEVCASQNTTFCQPEYMTTVYVGDTYYGMVDSTHACILLIRPNSNLECRIVFPIWKFEWFIRASGHIPQFQRFYWHLSRCQDWSTRRDYGLRRLRSLDCGIGIAKWSCVITGATRDYMVFLRGRYHRSVFRYVFCLLTRPPLRRCLGYWRI